MEPNHKWRRVESPEERAKMLVAFEDIWAAWKRSSPCPGLSSFLLLVTPPMPPLAVLASVPLAVVLVVGVGAAAFSNALFSRR